MRKLLCVFLLPFLIVVLEGCASTPSEKVKINGPSMTVWVSPDYRDESVYVEVPVRQSRRR